MRFLAISLRLPLRRPIVLGLALLGMFCALAPKFTLVSAQAATAPPASAPAAPIPAPPVPAAEPAPEPSQIGPSQVSEEDLRRRLVGKSLYLRGGYLGDSISFNEHGLPTGHPTIGSYTLSAVEIEKVNLTKHKLELRGTRYALHFLGATPYEDPGKALERVKITPKKKILKITIDREQVQKPKKIKEPKPAKMGAKPASAVVASGDAPATTTPAATTEVEAPDDKSDAKSDAQSEEKPEEQAADPASVTTTISPAHAAHMLYDALDHIFAEGLDEKVRAQMPEFWQLYYQAQAKGVDYHPKDPAVLRSSAVDQQAKLLTAITPDSNEFAQANGIAGRALYRAVIGSDGKPAEIAVVRPIGFGLDENAVAAIRKASFQPAVKGGQPVAETLDLAVLFRIYSKRTSVAAAEAAPEKPAESAKPVLPGPYTVKAPPPTPNQ